MDLIIDASSIINFYNANALSLLVSLSNVDVYVSPLVVGECDPSCAAALVDLGNSGELIFVDPNDVSAESYLTLLSDYQLGEGETECLALGIGRSFVFCCDDRKARQVASAILGEGRVVGSLRVLRWCVDGGILNEARAREIYDLMRQAGGFLPNLPVGWFDNGD